MLIGITGTDGAGKGAVVNYLTKEKHFTHYSSRKLILEHIRANNLPTTRNQMRLTANQLRKKYGNAFVIEQSYKKAEKDGAVNVVIESLRAVAEGEYLKNNGGVLIAVDAAVNVRYKRVQNRRSESDAVTFTEFNEHEELEKNDPNPHGMQKAKVIEMAEYTITNNGTLEELYLQIENVLQKIQM